MNSSGISSGLPAGSVHPIRLRRSVLSVPAVNIRALEKVSTLHCDAVIFDLEDSVAPERKAEARDNLERLFSSGLDSKHERIIRINGLQSPEAEADMALVLSCCPDAVLLPKVNAPHDVQAACDMLTDADASDDLRIWAMIETPRGVLNAAAIAEYGRTAGARLDCFVVGLNDLRKETGVMPGAGRQYLVPWLMQVVLAARAFGLDVIDSVSNDFNDIAAFEEECAQGRAMGFDGKMLIHPAQIAASNAQFGVSDTALAEALEIIAAFARPEAAGLNVINADGRMIERLHLEQAERLVIKATSAKQRRENQA